MVIAVVVLVFALIFRAEIETAVYVWANSDAYNHCFLVLPVAIYLGWRQRDRIAAASPRATPWIVLLAIPIAIAWFVAERLGIMEARQLMAMSMLQIAIAAVLGFQAWRALATPLLYLFLMVPFGEFAVPVLQTVVVHFTVIGLSLFGIANFSNGVVIEIPEGTFLVHEACSGLRFLIATFAFGVLYACVMYTAPLRRSLFVILSLAVAIIGNCLRVLGTIMVAHFIGNTQAVAADHVLWGWGFYVIIGGVLIAAGLPFRQDEPNEARGSRAPTTALNRMALLVVLAFTILMAGVPRVAASYLEKMGSEPAKAVKIELPALAGCSIIPASTEAHALIESVVANSNSSNYECSSDRFMVAVYQFPPRVGARQLFSTVRSAITPSGWDILQMGDFSVGGSLGTWRVTEGSVNGSYAAAATALWIGGRPTGTGIDARFRQALNATWSGARSPILVVVTYYGANSPSGARRAIDAFLPRTTPIAELIGRSS